MLQRHPREGGHPRNSPYLCDSVSWVPASAGMTLRIREREFET